MPAVSQGISRPPETLPTPKASPKEGKSKKIDALPLLKGAYDMAIQEDDWANLATMGFYLHQLDPGFDPRTYGFKQLSQLIKSYPIFESRFLEQSRLCARCLDVASHPRT